MRTRVLLAWLLVVALASPALAPATTRAAALTVGGTAVARTDDQTGLNMRSGPSRDTERVGGINEGDAVTVVDGPFYDKDGAAWYQVDYKGLNGYAYGDFLVPVDAAASPPPSAPRSAFQFSANDVGVIPILMYHHVDDSGGTYAVTPEQLDAQCQWLLANGYTAITLSQFYDAAFAGGLLPAKPVVFTADDGWASALTFAEILARYGFIGNYFVNNASEVTPDQVAYLSRVGEVEDHTASHAALSRLDYAGQYAEIANNKAYLEAATGQTVRFLAWPYGDWNASAVQAAAAAGMIAAFDA